MGDKHLRLNLKKIALYALVFLSIISFLNRSPFGDPSDALKTFLYKPIASEKLVGFIDRQDANSSLDDNGQRPIKIWKKYVLEKIAITRVEALEQLELAPVYEIEVKQCQSRMFVSFGLAPPPFC